MNNKTHREKLKSAQRRAFRRWILATKSVQEIWSGWKRELILSRESEQL